MSYFTYIVLKSSWGVRATIEAVWKYVPEYPISSTKISEKLFLNNECEYLTEREKEFIHLGLRLIASEINEVFKDKESIVIVVKDVEYNPCDYQEEGLACAIMGWASQEFDITIPAIDVSFDKKANQYIFRFPQN